MCVRALEGLSEECCKGCVETRSWKRAAIGGALSKSK